ncbi:MAG: methyltransferase domain-containing protein [Gammaproteobacteria bacterium]|nr:methyltransferase domain-containing protein [Gammaproteobacteria bacterium]
MASQTWNAEAYDRNARFVSDLGMPVVELLDPPPDLVDAARKSGLNVSLTDAAQMDFHAEFDAVFSNAVLHWIKDADRVIEKVSAALKPGGRFVAECGGHKNIETIHDALVSELDTRGYDGGAASPWYFPTAQEYEERLTRAGFRVDYIEVIPRPTRLPGDILGFLETFAGTFAAVLPVAERQAYLEDVRNRVRPALCAEDGTWTADYTRLRFKACK